MDDSRSDLLEIDRTVRRATNAVARFRRTLHESKAIEEMPDPLEPFRSVAGASAVKSIREAKILPYEADIQAGLIRWSAALTDARVSLPLEVAWAKAVREPLGRFDGDPPALVSYRDAFRSVLSCRDEGEADRWMQAAAECSPNLGAIARERLARAAEVEKRLADVVANDTRLPVSARGITDGAAAFLVATRDLAIDGRRRQKRAVTASSAVLDALARDAGDGWPARPSTRWLEELFAKYTHGLTITLPPPVAPRGAASFARTLATWGESFRRACPAASLPFSLAHEPEFVSALRCGLLFGSLPTQPVFHKRGLGTGERVAFAQARSLTLTALFEARRIATQAILQLEGDARFPELTEELFGVALDERFHGVFPNGFERADTRALALLTVLPLAESMVERFDFDWFRNPKAFASLRAEFSGPAREALPSGDAKWDAKAHGEGLARAFEKALG